MPARSLPAPDRGGLACALRRIQALSSKPAAQGLGRREEAALLEASGVLDRAIRGLEAKAKASPEADGALLVRLTGVRDRLGEHLRFVNRLRIERMRAAIEAGRFEEGFAAGSEILGAWWRTAEDLETVMCPTDRDGRILPARAMYRLLAKVGAGPWPAALRPWYRMLRVLLLDRLNWSEDAFLESAKLRDLPPRYAWMRVHRGLMLQRIRLDFAGAREEFDAVLAAVPWFWKAGAFAAESALCLGDRKGAFRIMDGLAARLEHADRVNCVAWRGAMRLWCGDYAGALKDLESVGAGAALGLCWKGAANYLLGRLDAAEADLDACIAKWPTDQEALIWRGELRCRQGRWKEGLSDFDKAVELGNAPVWGYINRSRAKARLGDEAGMWSDFYAISDRVRTYFEWKLGPPIDRGCSPGTVARFLESVLKAGGGVRRQDVYMYPLWMKPPR